MVCDLYYMHAVLSFDEVFMFSSKRDQKKKKDLTSDETTVNSPMLPQDGGTYVNLSGMNKNNDGSKHNVEASPVSKSISKSKRRTRFGAKEALLGNMDEKNEQEHSDLDTDSDLGPDTGSDENKVELSQTVLKKSNVSVGNQADTEVTSPLITGSASVDSPGVQGHSLEKGNGNKDSKTSISYRQAASVASRVFRKIKGKNKDSLLADLSSEEDSDQEDSPFMKQRDDQQKEDMHSGSEENSDQEDSLLKKRENTQKKEDAQTDIVSDSPLEFVESPLFNDEAMYENRRRIIKQIQKWDICDNDSFKILENKTKAKNKPNIDTWTFRYKNKYIQDVFNKTMEMLGTFKSNPPSHSDNLVDTSNPLEVTLNFAKGGSFLHLDFMKILKDSLTAERKKLQTETLTITHAMSDSMSDVVKLSVEAFLKNSDESIELALQRTSFNFTTGPYQMMEEVERLKDTIQNANEDAVVMLPFLKTHLMDEIRKRVADQTTQINKAIAASHLPELIKRSISTYLESLKRESSIDGDVMSLLKLTKTLDEANKNASFENIRAVMYQIDAGKERGLESILVENMRTWKAQQEANILQQLDTTSIPPFVKTEVKKALQNYIESINDSSDHIKMQWIDDIADMNDEDFKHAVFKLDGLLETIKTLVKSELVQQKSSLKNQHDNLLSNVVKKATQDFIDLQLVSLDDTKSIENVLAIKMGIDGLIKMSDHEKLHYLPREPLVKKMSEKFDEISRAIPSDFPLTNIDFDEALKTDTINFLEQQRNKFDSKKRTVDEAIQLLSMVESVQQVVDDCALVVNTHSSPGFERYLIEQTKIRMARTIEDIIADTKHLTENSIIKLSVDQFVHIVQNVHKNDENIQGLLKIRTELDAISVAAKKTDDPERALSSVLCLKSIILSEIKNQQKQINDNLLGMSNQRFKANISSNIDTQHAAIRESTCTTDEAYQSIKQIDTLAEMGRLIKPITAVTKALPENHVIQLSVEQFIVQDISENKISEGLKSISTAVAGKNKAEAMDAISSSPYLKETILQEARRQLECRVTLIKTNICNMPDLIKKSTDNYLNEMQAAILPPCEVNEALNIVDRINTLAAVSKSDEGISEVLSKENDQSGKIEQLRQAIQSLTEGTLKVLNRTIFIFESADKHRELSKVNSDILGLLDELSLSTKTNSDPIIAKLHEKLLQLDQITNTRRVHLFRGFKGKFYDRVEKTEKGMIESGEIKSLTLTESNKKFKDLYKEGQIGEKIEDLFKSLPGKK